MPMCLYLRGRTSWGNWPEKFRFRIVLGFSKQARKVPMRNWPAHARELHRSDVEGSEATRHVGPPRVGVTGACQYSQPDCWPVRPLAIRRNMRLAFRRGRFYRRFAQITRIGTIRPKHTIVLFQLINQAVFHKNPGRSHVCGYNLGVMILYNRAGEIAFIYENMRC